MLSPKRPGAATNIPEEERAHRLNSPQEVLSVLLFAGWRRWACSGAGHFKPPVGDATRVKNEAWVALRRLRANLYYVTRLRGTGRAPGVPIPVRFIPTVGCCAVHCPIAGLLRSSATWIEFKRFPIFTFMVFSFLARGIVGSPIAATPATCAQRSRCPKEKEPTHRGYTLGKS